MDHERNFSRGGQTDGRTGEQKMHFQLSFEKGGGGGEGKGGNRRRAFGMYLGEPRNMRRTRDLLGEFSIGSYLPPPVLPAPNGRPMIDNGESGSPTFFFFFLGERFTTASTLLFRSRALIARANRCWTRARVAYVSSMYVSLEFVLLWQARAVHRTAFHEEIHIYSSFWIIPRF